MDFADQLLADTNPGMSLFLEAFSDYGDKIKKVHRMAFCCCPSRSYLSISFLFSSVLLEVKQEPKRAVWQGRMITDHPDYLLSGKKRNTML